jgi:hypothetical protein
LIIGWIRRYIGRTVQNGMRTSLAVWFADGLGLGLSDGWELDLHCLGNIGWLKSNENVRRVLLAHEIAELEMCHFRKCSPSCSMIEHNLSRHDSNTIGNSSKAVLSHNSWNAARISSGLAHGGLSVFLWNL